VSSAHCTSNASSESPLARRAFETRDSISPVSCGAPAMSCFDLRDEGGRKVFVFQDRPTRRDDVMAFYCEAGSVRPLERPEGAHSQCMMYPRLLSRTATTARGGLRGSLWTDYGTAFSNIRSLARLAKTCDGNS
jgi:hypothetical protein